MNILWFSLSPCGSLRRSNSKRVIQGWMISLEDQIKKNVDINLSVCYITGYEELDFEYDGVHYYPVSLLKSKNRIMQMIDRYKSVANVENVIVPQLLRVVDKVNPDVIHIHGTEECFGLIQDYIKNIPIVFSIQGLIAPCTEKYFSGFPESFVRRHESLIHKFRGLSIINSYNSFKYRSKRELRYLKKAKYVIGRTFWDHNIPLLCNPNVKMFQGEEILRKEFYTAKWEKTLGRKLSIVTTISPGVYKGYEILLHSSLLLKEFANFDFEWHVIGYEKQDKFVQLAEKLKCCKSEDANIFFHGKMQAEEMLQILLKSDVYVQVSHIENSPNSLCEAMLLGMPIIASFAGGTSSMLKDGEEGILVQDGDPYILAGAIVNLKNNFERAIQMGRLARERAIKRHNPTNIANHLVDIYKEIQHEKL